MHELVQISDAMRAIDAQIAALRTRPTFGTVDTVNQTIVTARWDCAVLGQVCRFGGSDGDENLGEVVGIDGNRAIISALSECTGLHQGAPIAPLVGTLNLPVGMGLLGRVVDGLGRPIDGLGPITDAFEEAAIRQAPPSAMDRLLIEEPLTTGLRAIDGLTTIGCGQRIGIFGPPGTGKSSLLAAIAQHTTADIIVIGLIGERGREVREFLDRHLPVEKRDKVVAVAATSDRSPLERFYGAHSATAIAEWFRDQGYEVLLLVDSLTRVARALREIGLARGEAPTRRGYPASVYPALPALVERSGRTEAGSITAIYTVLVEGDGEADPIAEETRSLTDGHIVLSQEIADSGRYPAIDVSKSLSRVMSAIAQEPHQVAAQNIREMIAKYAEIELLIQVGEFKPGNDPIADRAVAAMPAILKLLRQPSSEPSALEETVARMVEVAE